MIHSLYTICQGVAGKETTINFPRSDIILIGLQFGSPNSYPVTAQFDLGGGIYAYPNGNAGLLGNGGFNPFLYKITGNSISLSTPGLTASTNLNLFYVNDISDLTAAMKRYPPLSLFAGIQMQMGNVITIPESTPAHQSIENMPFYNFTLDLPNADLLLNGLWLNDFVINSKYVTDGSDFVLKFPSEHGQPLYYMGSTSYENVYPYLPISYYSTAQKLNMAIGYNGGNSSTSASIKAGLNAIFYYDFNRLAKSINDTNPFSAYLPVRVK